MRVSRAWYFSGLLAGVGVLATGCGKPTEKKVTELQRKEAAHLASEAQFALTLRDYPRAEGLFAKAAEAAPDTPALWVSLGSARVKQGKREQARQAYQSALKAYEAEAERDKADAEPWLKQTYVLALLGRVDDARALLQKAAKKFPENRNVRMFIEGKQLDRILADPAFKDASL